MHGNILNKNKIKLFNTANSDLAGRIIILENNVYKITYYEIISGASGTLTVPTAATINADEFSGADCILSEIDGNNKPTWVSPKTVGGTVVTATLNTGTGAWVKSGVTVSANVALIYSLNIRAADYANLTNFYIVEETVIGDLSYVLNNTTTNSVASSLLAGVISDETGSGALVFGTSPTFVTDITTPLIIGGTTNNSYLTYKATTGTGASADPAHIFTGGANGATEIMRLLNGGKVGIGTNPTGAAYLQVNSNTTDEVASFTSSDAIAYLSLTDSTGTAYVGTGSTGRLFLGSTASVNSGNLIIMAGGAGMGYGITLPAISGLHIQKTTEQLRLAYDANNYASFTTSSVGGLNIGTVAVTTGASTALTITVPANTGQSASTEISNFKVVGASKTWSAGAITTQRWNYFTANTAAFASASTISESYGLYVEAATAGSNATITNNFALGLLAGTGTIKIGNITGSSSTTGIYFNQATPSGSNYVISAGTTDTILNAPSADITFRIANVTRVQINPSATTGTSTTYTFNAPNNTNQTASTEINGYLYNSYSRTWAAGAITTQREQYIKTVTYAFASASTITNAYGFYVEAPTAGSNATITNNWAAGFSGNVEITSSGTTKIKVLSGGGVDTYIASEGAGSAFGSLSAHNVVFYRGNSLKLTMQSSSFLFADAYNLEFNNTTGSKIGTASNQKIAFWNATPIVQPTTAVAAATFVANTSAIANDTATFDGYTIGQVVKALRNIGLLA